MAAMESRIYTTKENWVVLEVWSDKYDDWVLSHAAKIFDCEEENGSRTIDSDMLPADFMFKVLKCISLGYEVNLVPLSYIDKPYIPDDIKAKLVIVREK